MPQLRSCYFCGTTGDALEEYEVVPERLVDEEAHSAVLCPDCHDKLRRVVEPFVTGSTRPDRTGHGISPHQEVTFESAEDGTSDPSTDGHLSDDDTESSGVDGLAPDLDRSDTSGGASDGSADDGGTDDGTADEETGDAGAGESSSEGGGGRRDDDVPDGYYKVLRLLQNREFPIDRSELMTIVTGAYDITEPQCERILDAAVERGVLVRDGSTLDLGRN